MKYITAVLFPFVVGAMFGFGLHTALQDREGLFIPKSELIP